MSNDKAYCKHCKHFRGSKQLPKCMHPGNIRDQDDWYEYRGTFKASPPELNSENDCSMYQPKERCHECGRIK